MEFGVLEVQYGEVAVLSDWESICTVTGAKKGKKIRKNTFLPSVFKSVKQLQVIRTVIYSGP